MRAMQVQRQPADSGKEPFTAYLALSVAVHGIVALGLVGGAWLVGPPAASKPSSYTVTLMDAPLTLQQPRRSGGQPKPSGRLKTPALAPNVLAEKRATQPTQTVLPKRKPPAAKPVPTVVIAPPRQAAAVKPKPKPTTTAKTTLPHKKRQAASRQPKTRPKHSVKTAAAAASKKPRQTTAVESASKATRTTKSAALPASPPPAVARRLAALRGRHGSGTARENEAETRAGLQRVRLQAYQDRLQHKIIAAWTLPMLHEEARHLHATARFAISRDGQIIRLELLKTSGKPLFDDSLLRAIQQAAPLPALPPDYRDKFLEVVMRFQPRDSS
ncbi:hypothetical protein NKDENANG_01792 [Candidatus Entotheonellaceae bacterium PAL068K]